MKESLILTYINGCNNGASCPLTSRPVSEFYDLRYPFAEDASPVAP